MIALAWAKVAGWLGGVGAQAIAGAVALALIVGGVWWLRMDARWDERAHWERRQLAARLADQMKLRARKAAQDVVAAKAAEALRNELELARQQVGELEAKLSARPDVKDGKRVVVFPADMIGAINK